MLYPLRYYQKCITFFTVFIFTPGFFLFEMNIVRPKLVEIYNVGAVKNCLHVFFSSLCFMNVIGNMLLSILIDPSLKRSHKNGMYCSICQILRPDGSWHCTTCNVCVERRDHHCLFLSRCIGLNNQRYFILFLGHVMISMIYSCYYNYYFISSLFKDHGMFLSFIRILNPLVRYVIPEPMDYRDFFTFLLFINVGLLIWSTFLFTSHMKNVLKGLTAYESKASHGNLPNWRENLTNVFGDRWLLAMIFPFAVSTLPDMPKTH